MPRFKDKLVFYGEWMCKIEAVQQIHTNITDKIPLQIKNSFPWVKDKNVHFIEPWVPFIYRKRCLSVYRPLVQCRGTVHNRLQKRATLVFLFSAGQRCIFTLSVCLSPIHLEALEKYKKVSVIYFL